MFCFRKNWRIQTGGVSFEKVGERHEFAGAALPARNGKTVGFSRRTSDRWGDNTGIFTFGPYAELPPGDYSFELHYFADTEKTGTWDIAITNSEKIDILRSGTIRHAGKNVVSSTLSLPDGGTAEMRTFYNGHGTLFVDKIVIARLGNMTDTASPEKMEVFQSATRAADLTLIQPINDTKLVDPVADFVWHWNGPALADNQAFEIRIWHEEDSIHYGAHDAARSAELIRQVDDVFVAYLHLNGVHSVAQHGPGTYYWSVAIVETQPDYRDLGFETDPQTFSIVQH